jgi:tetratricopeptide (TPR) repeat protein
MKLIVRSRVYKLTAGAILAGSIALLQPSLVAQLPAPPPAVTSGDAREFDAASALMDAKKTKEAMKAFEKFLEKYKMLSPKSLEAKFKLAVCYILEGDYESPIRHLKEIIANPKIEAGGKEAAQMLIAKAITMKASKMPGESEPQKQTQNKIFEQAIAEYETFLKLFPRSKEFDSAHFLRATLLMHIGKYDDSFAGYQAVEKLGPNATPLYWDSVLSSGRVLFASASALMEMKAGKEPKPEDVQKALKVFEQAQPILVKVFQGSGDVAMTNEATYYAAQMQLARSQNVNEADEEKSKKLQQDYLSGAYDAFRAVRAREEVLAAQEAKIARLTKLIESVPPGIDRQLQIARIENLIDIEQQKLERYKADQDQYLAAKMALARIYLFLKKPDESRTMMRYLQGQGELLKSDPEALPTVTAMLGLTYAEQNNVEKTLASYQDFRGKFKGNPNGDNLPLLLAKLLIDSGKNENVEKAIAVVGEGMADYKNWRFIGEANALLAAALTKLGRYDEALKAIESAIGTTPKDDVLSNLLYVKANILEVMAREKQDAAKADEALAAYKVVIDRFGNTAYAEDAEFGIAQIQAGKNPTTAIALLQKFVDTYSAGSPKSENTPKNLPVAQYLLGKCLDGTNQKDLAIAAMAKLAEKWPDSEPAPGSFFQRFNIYNERKDYPKCAELMEAFIKAYPKHENVYFAFNNIAEIAFSKPGAEGKSPDLLQNTRDGVKKLNEFVDFELEQNPEVKRGDQALVKIATRWITRIPQKNFLIMNADEKLVWQEAVEAATKAVEKVLEKYADQPQELNKVGEGLEKLVVVQRARTAADPANAAKVGQYFKELATKYDSKPSVRSNVLFALGAVLWDKNRSEAMRSMNDAYKADVKFTADDLDRYMEGLFDEKKYVKVNEIAAKLAADYPKEAAEPQATSLFWQGKVLGAQNKVSEAASKYKELQTSFGSSKKVLEADYGVILAKVNEGKLEDDFIPRLQKVVNTPTKNFELPAKALFLIARIQEMEKDYDSAIDNFIKIHTRYESVPSVSSEGLWRGSQLLEKQAKKELPVMLPAERKKFLESRKKPAAPKAEPAKPVEEKPADKKAADPKVASAGVPNAANLAESKK